MIELGSGTGAVTKALVDAASTPTRLVLVEFNPHFCRLLRRRYPTATVIQGDAYRIEHLLGGLLKRRRPHWCPACRCRPSRSRAAAAD